MPEIVILGGGLTGLSSAYFLKGKDWCLLERENRFGGLCRSEREDGFCFDYTGHWIHLSRPETRSLLKSLLGKNLETHVRNTWIYSKERYTRYPFQANTFGLPVDVVRECLLGSIEAYYGRSKGTPQDFQEWIMRSFGSGIAKHFMVPYNKKLWTVHPRGLTCDWLGKYIPKPNLEEIITGALSDSAASLGYNSVFHYPKSGGIQSLVDAFVARLPAKRLLRNREVTEVDLRRKVIRTRDGEPFAFEKLIVTVPLSLFSKILVHKPASLSNAALKLKHNSVVNFNFGVFRPVGQGRHWVYVPEPGYAFYRIGFPGNVCAGSVPDGFGSISAEVAFRGKPPDRVDLRKRVIADLIRAGILKSKREIVQERELHIPCAYVIFDAHRKAAFSTLQNHLRKRDVFLAGRYGAWEYSAMEDAILWGEKASGWAACRP